QALLRLQSQIHGLVYFSRLIPFEAEEESLGVVLRMISSSLQSGVDECVSGFLCSQSMEGHTE
ncbi:hypothetical protein VVF07_30125, partial [Pseudomonas aeruginosa]|uniref:hypothetical protein n=1 Tax=Pseudomonas aeruginosa TaxID=287 RepID=UPI0030095474